MIRKRGRNQSAYKVAADIAGDIGERMRYPRPPRCILRRGKPASVEKRAAELTFQLLDRA
jgi:hypothetical protein